MGAFTSAGDLFYWTDVMTTPKVNKVEQAILDLLADFPDEEVLGRDLRGLLGSPPGFSACGTKADGAG
jgi:hypothetical protein